MTYYPTTLLPPSLPYRCLDELVMMLCDRCLIIQDCSQTPEADKQQLFDLTMKLMTFWEKELAMVEASGL